MDCRCRPDDWCRVMPFITIAICIAAAPVTTIAVMALLGLAALWPAVLAIGITIVAAVVFTLAWARDLDLLTAAVRVIDIRRHRFPNHFAGGTTCWTGRPDVDGSPWDSNSHACLRRPAARAALIEQERRADTLILERLPDALVVLRQDRSVSRRNPAAEAIF